MRLGPGESKRWRVRLDHRAFYAGVPEERQNDWSGLYTFKKPGKYEVLVRYLNLNRKLEEQTAFDRLDPPEMRLFGPFDVEVTARPAKEPDWVATVTKDWKDTHSTPYDMVRGARDEEIKELASLTIKEMRAVGPLGDDVWLWMLARELRKLQREKSDGLKRYLVDLDQAVEKLPANHPNRAAAEFLGVVARLQSGEEASVVRQALTSSNPDVQLVVADWLEKSEKARKKK